MDIKNAFWISFGWMTAEDGLGLSGSELSVYALVYSISQRGLGAYFASLETTGKILGMTSKTAHHALKSLVKKGLLKKQDIMKDGVKLCEYTALPLGMEEISEGAWKNFPYPMEKISIPPMEKISDKNKSFNDKSKANSKAPAPLILPFSSDRFRQTWEALCEEKEWKKKSDNALRLTLKKLGRYDEAFAIELMERAIEGGWRGVVFQDTDAKYQEWKSARQLKEDNRQPRTTPAQGKPKQIDPNNQVDAFYREKRRAEEEERARLIAELKAKHGITDGDANDKASG